MKSQLATAPRIVAIMVATMTTLPRHTASVARGEFPKAAAPVLINACIITSDINRLTAFYQQVLQIEAHKEGESYVEFRTDATVLALFAADAQERYIPGSALAGQNRSVILEFRVGNVDREYARVRDIVKLWVKGPTNQPWGTRSIYFRDPDGNLVDFFERIRPRTGEIHQ
jgi:catechol 2,3-dioxygenase-like lactoylglutathione lyase family enzyme